MIGVLLALTACAFVGSDEEETALRCADCRKFQVGRVFDGDTVISPSDRVVRLFGVDAPEEGQRCAAEATKRLRELAGTTIRLEDGPTPTDEFGRMSAYAYTLDGVSIDEILVREGLANASTGKGQHREYLSELEWEAKTKDAGCLWS